MFSVSRPTVVYDGAVTSADSDEWGHEFDAVMGRMRSLFYRTESKKHAEQYVRGLLSPLARKNGWTISEYVGEPEPKALQRLLNPLTLGRRRAAGSQSRVRDGESGRPGRDTGCRSHRFRKKGPHVGGCAAAIFRNARSDRQLSDRHLFGVCDAGPGQGADRSAAVPAGALVDGRPGPLRPGGRPAGGHVPDQTPAGAADDRGRPGGRGSVHLVHRRRRIRPEPRPVRLPRT